MAADGRRFALEVGSGTVAAVWTDAPGAGAVMVVGHGAGGGMDSPFLAGFSRGAAQLGLGTLRFTFPYMQRPGRRPPDRPEVLIAATWAAFTEAQRLAAGRAVLAGGKSLGGRMASMAAAEGMPPAGLGFFGAPPHPPRRAPEPPGGHPARVQAALLVLP